MNKNKKNEKKLAKSAERHKRHSTQAIWVTVIIVSCLFISMSIYMVDYSRNHELEMFDNSYNSYSIKLAKEHLRGSIYSSDGVKLAYSEGEDAAHQKRIYPYDNLYAHVIGYSSHGRMGVESISNYYLLNYHSGIGNMAEANANDTLLTADSVYTTIDSKLQQVVYDSLGIYKGAAIVTEVKTGRILAMVSKPDFNPNTIDSNWDSWISDTDNSQLLNRVTQGLYPPGSTFKIITSLEYIREHNNDYSKYSYNCNGRFMYGDNSIRCYHGSVHGNVDFSTSFAKSCNSSFANIGIGLDKKTFKSTLDSLMFDQKLPIELPSSISTTAINEQVDDHNLMQASIGQGQDSISPIHLNMITCSIANDGLLMKPYLVDYVKSSSGVVVKEFMPEKIGNLITEDESNILTELMQGVVQNGTGSKLKGLPYTAAGKTGSAEFNSNADDSHAWFTGFAPVENPEICVTIIIEGAGSGGEYAVPITKRIFDAYFNN